MVTRKSRHENPAYICSNHSFDRHGFLLQVDIVKTSLSIKGARFTGSNDAVFCNPWGAVDL
jgi:hypothetical protein